MSIFDFSPSISIPAIIIAGTSGIVGMFLFIIEMIEICKSIRNSIVGEDSYYV